MIEHLIALRKHLLIAITIWFIIFLALLPFAKQWYLYLANPLISLLSGSETLIAVDLISPFFTPIKLTFYLSLFLAMPLIMHQLWLFIKPALYRHEIQIATPLLLIAIVLFYLGVLFGFLVVFPMIFSFLTNAKIEQMQLLPDINRYLSFSLSLLIAFGLAFQTPIITFVLVKIFGYQTIANKRPYLVILFFTIAMFVTPPDIFSQILLGLPIYILYEVGLFASYLLIKKQR